KRVTSSTPIVMATGGDVVGTGIVASLARTGGNVTGVISLTSELSGKRLELLQQLIPRVSRVAVLRDPDNSWAQAFVSNAERAAKSLGIVLQVVSVHGH